jgi:quercetin dioxygenase-like cupin family protein
MTLRILEFGRDRAVPIEVYASRAAASVPLGSGRGEARVYALHFEPGGSIGRHRAGFGQLFVVVSGSGWVEGDDGTRKELAPGQAAWFARGEMHAKGSESGLMALMVQVDDLEPHS